MGFAEPTREHGLQRLSAFAPKSGRDYAARRNFDAGPGEHFGNVSCLSPWHSRRLVFEGETVEAALQHYAPTTAEKFIQEVFWRSYFKGWLEMRPHVWRAWTDGVEARRLELEENAGLRSVFQGAVEGRTEIDCMNCWANELVETGYLHNHARMWFASIWIFTLGLPWELGADFFYRHLLDGDAASNTLGWRWVAGLHTKGKNYVARAGNIAKFTSKRFYPKGQLNEEAEPLPDDGLSIAPGKLPMFPEAPDSRDGSAGLLLLGDDLSPETSEIAEESVSDVAAGYPKSLGEGYQLDKKVTQFSRVAISDALQRAEKHYDATIEELGSDGGFVERIVDWAKRREVERVLAHAPFVGPWREETKGLRDALAHEGIQLQPLRRRWDQLSFPHCKKGFFGLKKRLPEIMGELGLRN